MRTARGLSGEQSERTSGLLAGIQKELDGYEKHTSDGGLNPDGVPSEKRPWPSGTCRCCARHLCQAEDSSRSRPEVRLGVPSWRRKRRGAADTHGRVVCATMCSCPVHAAHSPPRTPCWAVRASRLPSGRCSLLSPASHVLREKLEKPAADSGRARRTTAFHYACLLIPAAKEA